MLESFFPVLTFTALFGGIGVVQLRRCAALWSAGAAPGQDKAVELAHLLMSLAMVAMVWAWGGPAAWWLQLVVFGLLTVLFVGCAVATRGFGSWGYHALAVGAMTWMVVAMPLLGHSIGAGGAGHGHGGAAGMAQPVATPVGAAPLWVVIVTVTFAGVLAVSALARLVAGAGAELPVVGRHHALMSVGMAGMLLVLV